ncbi:MAG: signal peptidase I [Methanomicrobiales archaeon]
MDDSKRKYLEIIIYVSIFFIALFCSQHMNVVVSKSMEPVLHRGDVVIIEKTNFMGINEINTNDIKVGDIVIYNATWFTDGPVIHRVIASGIDKNGLKYYIIKGDNNPAPDPAVVYPAQIIAKAVKIGDRLLIIPQIGHITLKIRGI